MEIKDTDIVFVTTTIYTKWQEYSAQQVKKFFPESEHIHIDGRTGWFDVWFEWINKLEGRKEKYFVHLDEDCFLVTRQGVLDTIEMMEHEGSVLAGIQDSNFYWRNFNSMCLNPFFMIGKRHEIVEACQKPYRHLRFNEKYLVHREGYGSRGIIKGSFEITEYEPYYCFFYNMFEHGYHFSYLYPHDDFRFANNEGKLPATTVRGDSGCEDICIHMWYTRQWANEENLPRYTKLEKYLNE